MTDLYDLDASHGRMFRTQKDVDDQRCLIATLGPSAQRDSAEKNLVALLEMRAFAEKTHLIIMRVSTQRALSGGPGAPAV